MVTHWDCVWKVLAPSQLDLTILLEACSLFTGSNHARVPIAGVVSHVAFAVQVTGLIQGRLLLTLMICWC